MIKNSKQNWTVGSNVKIGFMALTVRAAIQTPGDYLPDAYILSNLAGTKLYRFVPHNGLNEISIDEARDLVEGQKEYEASIQRASAINAAKAAEINAVFA